MVIRLLTVTMLLVSASWVLGATPTGALVHKSELAVTGPITVCRTASVGVSEAQRPEFLAAMPNGIKITAIAIGTAQPSAGETVLELRLDEIALSGNAQTKTTRMPGPTLFWIQESTVELRDNGHARHAPGESELGPGTSILVEANHLVQLRNFTKEPVRVLVLTEQPVTSGHFPGGPVNMWAPMDAAGEVSARNLARAEIGDLPDSEPVLFIACLSWTGSRADVGPAHYAGPVGLLVLRGEVLVNEVERLGPGACWISLGLEPFRLQSRTGSADIVLFGALTTTGDDAAAIEDSVSSSFNTPSLACSGTRDVETISVPNIAMTVTPLPWTLTPVPNIAMTSTPQVMWTPTVGADIMWTVTPAPAVASGPTAAPDVAWTVTPAPAVAVVSTPAADAVWTPTPVE
jgi:hypothetical protein